MSLPYHDRRAVPGHPRADHLVGPSVGLTLQANRQAVLDVRRTLRWLEQHGYDRLGILGTSIGSSIAFVTMCHEPAIRAGAFLHVATYCGDVVANGLTTMNVWESLQSKLSQEDIRRYWSPISPFPYISKLLAPGRKFSPSPAATIPRSGRNSRTRSLTKIQRDGVEVERMSLPCGHYSMGVAPFKYAVGFRFGTFLFQSLAS